MREKRIKGNGNSKPERDGGKRKSSEFVKLFYSMLIDIIAVR